MYFLFAGAAHCLRESASTRANNTMRGCKIFVGLLFLAPLVLVASLFVVSLRLGLIGLAIILVAGVTYLGLGFLVTRAREVCPACDAKKLKCINWFRANRPPNWTFYRCEECGEEYVKVDGESGLVERGQSRFKDAEGWGAG